MRRKQKEKAWEGEKVKQGKSVVRRQSAKNKSLNVFTSVASKAIRKKEQQMIIRKIPCECL